MKIVEDDDNGLLCPLLISFQGLVMMEDGIVDDFWPRQSGIFLGLVSRFLEGTGHAISYTQKFIVCVTPVIWGPPPIRKSC